jgi:hypothetical protein
MLSTSQGDETGLPVYGITTRDKPATNAALRDSVERLCNRLDQRLDRSGLGAVQTRFDLRPALRNRVEVGRLGRQLVTDIFECARNKGI